MKTISVLDMLAVAVSAVVLFASGYLYYLTPSRPWSDGLPVAVMCIAWTARWMLHARGRADPACQAGIRKIRLAIVLAGSLLAVALLVQPGWSPAGQFGKRTIGVLMGLIVVFSANDIPKQASPRGLRLRRIAGWALVLGGLGYSLAWVAMPLAHANTAALISLLLGIAYMVVRITWLLIKHRLAPRRPG